MLRKIVLFSLPMFILLGTVTTVVAFEHQRTPDWQQALSYYLEQTRPSAVDTVVQEKIKAMLPWNFRAEMGRAFLEPRKWPWTTERLPYPPDALYCLLVERTPTAAAAQVMEPTRQILYVAHHTDAMWRVGWVVHEGPIVPFDVTTMDDLVTIGCNFAARH